jgi:hypothetical protein
MRGIVSVLSARKFDLVSFHQARQERAEVKTCVDRACSDEILDSPDDTGRADVETGVAVLYPLVEGVGGPEPISVECSKASDAISSIANAASSALQGQENRETWRD